MIINNHSLLLYLKTCLITFKYNNYNFNFNGEENNEND